MKRLLRHFEDGAESIIEIDDRMVLVGSSAANDIVIRDASSCDVAFKIGPAGDGHVLEVIQKGKTRLNCQKIKRARLRPATGLKSTVMSLFMTCCMLGRRKKPPGPIFFSSHSLHLPQWSARNATFKNCLPV